MGAASCHSHAGRCTSRQDLPCTSRKGPPCTAQPPKTQHSTAQQLHQHGPWAAYPPPLPPQHTAKVLPVGQFCCSFAGLGQAKCCCRCCCCPSHPIPPHPLCRPSCSGASCPGASGARTRRQVGRCTAPAGRQQGASMRAATLRPMAGMPQCMHASIHALGQQQLHFCCLCFGSGPAPPSHTHPSIRCCSWGALPPPHLTACPPLCLQACTQACSGTAHGLQKRCRSACLFSACLPASRHLPVLASPLDVPVLPGCRPCCALLLLLLPTSAGPAAG